MAPGDLVNLKSAPGRIGIIVKTHAGLFETWFEVLWPSGQREVLDSSELEKLKGPARRVLR